MSAYFTTLPIDHGRPRNEHVRLGSISQQTIIKESGPVRRWAEMSDEERAALRKQYETSQLHARPGGLKCLCGSQLCPNPAAETDP